MRCSSRVCMDHPSMGPSLPGYWKVRSPKPITMRLSIFSEPGKSRSRKNLRSWQYVVGNVVDRGNELRILHWANWYSRLWGAGGVTQCRPRKAFKMLRPCLGRPQFALISAIRPRRTVMLIFGLGSSTHLWIGSNRNVGGQSRRLAGASLVAVSDPVAIRREIALKQEPTWLLTNQR